MITHNGIFVAIAFTMWAAPATLAQVSEPGHCDAARAAVASADARKEDFELLGNCPTSGPPAVAQAWARTFDADASAGLASTSMRLRDARVYDAVLSVARSPKRSTDTRLSALAVLASYTDSSLAVSPVVLRSGAPLDPIPRYATPLVTPRGLASLPSDRHRGIARLVATLARSDGDSIVRAAALRLRQSFAIARPDDTVVEEGTVTLTAGCGSRVMLRSTADIALPVEIRAGETFRDVRLLPAARADAPTAVPLGLPAGPVTVSVGHRVVARLPDRSAPCVRGQTH